MVQALAFLVPLPGTLTAFGIPLTTAAGGLTLAGSLTNLAGSALLGAAARAIEGSNRPPGPRPDNVQFNSKAFAGERIAHLGVAKAGGSIVFERAKAGFLYRVIVHGHGEIDGVVQLYLNNNPVSVDGSGFVTDDQYFHLRERVQLVQRQGAAPEAAFSEITSVWPAWTEDHRLNGLWKTLLIAEQVEPEKFNAMYPAREPMVQALARTTKVFDPRSNTTGFSENFMLCLAHYMASTDGMGEPDAFEAEDVAAAADICDQAAALAAGGTELRFRAGGSYGLNERRQDVLQRLLDSAGARLRLKPNGHLRPEMGAYVSPSLTLTYRDVIEVQEIVPGHDATRRYNILPARYVDQELGFVEVDADAWIDDERVQVDGGDKSASALALMFSPSHRQTRAALKLHVDRDNPQLIVRIRFKPSALEAIYESNVTLAIPELGLTGVFDIVKYDASFDGGNLTSLLLILHLIDPSAYSLGLEEQGTVQTLPDPDTPAGVPLPQNVVAYGAGVQASANTFAAGIGVGWQAPPSDALTPLLKVSVSDADNWQSVPVANGSTFALISGLVEGGKYDLTLSWVTPGGIIGDPVLVEDVTATAVSTPPDPPMGLTVSDNGNGNALIEVTEASSPGLWKTEIYRDAVLVATIFADAEPGSALTLIDACGPGTFDWTARSVNVSDIDSTTDDGPVTETIA